ncbi:hypothetical protein PT974_01396 [Cladobotryum mycophilum]|uniref:Uncharacterized protein n=1 Tax=Cladobotryum mycophilum TaxID=491253 RepID=A0ABR0T3I7_9HYPO
MVEEFHTLLARLHVAALRSEAMAARIPRPSPRVVRFQRSKVAPYANTTATSTLARKNRTPLRFEPKNFYI